MNTDKHGKKRRILSTDYAD